MIWFIGFAAARLAVATFCLLTAAYAALNCSPFAFDMFIRPQLFPCDHTVRRVASSLVPGSLLVEHPHTCRGPRLPRPERRIGESGALAGRGLRSGIRGGRCRSASVALPAQVVERQPCPSDRLRGVGALSSGWPRLIISLRMRPGGRGAR